MNITTTVTVDDNMLSALLVDAIEGGSGYWCNRLRLTKEPAGLTERPAYSDVKLWAEGADFEIEIRHDKTTAEDDGRKTLTRASFEQALQLMADNYPTYFTDVMKDETDADTADVFLQLACFKEIVFG